MIDAHTNAVGAAIPLSLQQAGGGIAVNERTDTVNVTNNGDNTVSVLTSSKG